jgi:tetratricopeptide (TPR) repeat protein
MSESLPPNPFMVPYERNPFFVGSNSFLETLLHQLGDGEPRGRVALFGMGGVGKTQTALEFVYRYRNYYNGIYWISAATPASLLAGYERIGKRVGIPVSLEAKPIEIVEHVLSWLKRTPNSLLVVDNLDDISVLSTQNLGEPNIVNVLLPESGPGPHMLITTRNRNADHIPAQWMIEVPLLNQLDSIRLLSSLSTLHVPTESAEGEAARQICQELGNLPLAISQAGAYIRQKSLSFTKFLKIYAKYRSRVNAWVPPGRRTYPYSVSTTWNISFDEIAEKNRMAAHFFRLLAFFNPDGILIEFLKSGMHGMDDDLRGLVSDEFALSEALRSLETYSLVKWDRQKSSIIVHRLVQAVFKDDMSETDLTTFRAMTVDICHHAFPNDWNNNNRALCRLYIGQIMGAPLDPDASETVKSAGVMDRVGWFLRDDGKIVDSERTLVRSLKIFLRILGAEHPDTLWSMNNLALTYTAEGRTGEAAALLEQVLEKDRQILGAEHPDTLRSMNNLASTYRDQGRTAEAANLWEEVLGKRRQIQGVEHPDTLVSMNNLASMYRHQGRIGEAAALEEEVLERRMRILGSEHPDTLVSMNNLTSMYRDQGRIGEAAALEEKVLEKRRRILGVEHPDTLRSMNNLASTYSAQGRMEEAAALEEEVLEKRRRILGTQHLHTLTSIGNLASTYRAQGRTVEAAALEQELFKRESG